MSRSLQAQAREKPAARLAASQGGPRPTDNAAHRACPAFPVPGKARWRRACPAPCRCRCFRSTIEGGGKAASQITGSPPILCSRSRTSMSAHPVLPRRQMPIEARFARPCESRKNGIRLWSSDASAPTNQCCDFRAFRHCRRRSIPSRRPAPAALRNACRESYRADLKIIECVCADEDLSSQSARRESRGHFAVRKLSSGRCRRSHRARSDWHTPQGRVPERRAVTADVRLVLDYFMPNPQLERLLKLIALSEFPEPEGAN